MELTGKDLAEGARNIDILRAIPEHRQHAKIRIAGKTVSVDVVTARALVVVHDALSPDNQPKFAGMLAQSTITFNRALDFAWKHVA